MPSGVSMNVSPKSDGALRSLDTLRAWLPQAVAGVPGAEYGVGGKVAQGVDFTDHLQRRLPWVVGFVLVPVPGGVGVREATFVAAAGSLDPGIAAATAVVARAVFVVVDVVGALLGALALRVARRRDAEAPPAT